MKQILVKIYWNTEADGSPVAEDVTEDDRPICYYGPFPSMADAESWMNNDYPDGDTDVHEMIADEFDLPEGTYINPPSLVTTGSE